MREGWWPSYSQRIDGMFQAGQRLVHGIRSKPRQLVSSRAGLKLPQPGRHTRALMASLRESLGVRLPDPRSQEVYLKVDRLQGG